MELFVLFQHIHYFNENAFFYVSSSNINKSKLVPYIFQYGIETDNISAGLDPVLSYTEKSSLAPYYRQFLHKYRNENHCASLSICPAGLTILVLIL